MVFGAGCGRDAGRGCMGRHGDVRSAGLMMLVAFDEELLARQMIIAERMSSIAVVVVVVDVSVVNNERPAALHDARVFAVGDL